jgi:small-conductance mechanosensitive channel
MAQWIDWLAFNWELIVIPLLVFLAIYVIGLWLRIILFRFLSLSRSWNRWRGNKVAADALRRPFTDWFILLGAYVAVQSSVLFDDWKVLASHIIGTLFVLSAAWIFSGFTEKLLLTYSPPSPNLTQKRQTTIVINVIRVTIIVIAVLVILSIWGAPINPILLIIAVIIFVGGLALRDAIPSYLFGLQLSSSRQIKVGDFIKLESGESGLVRSITWQNTQITSLQGDVLLIPNNKMARVTVINYGRPLKKAPDPFHFYTRLHLRELTGLNASNLTELVSILKQVPEAVVYYHVHRFLEEQLLLAPEPTNDFAIWVNTALGNDILGERLASIDTFAFPNIAAVRQRLVDTLEDYLRNNPDNRQAPEEEEFHFVRSISYILPTAYVAHDLREFVEILRKVTIDSIYFHIFESRLRLQKGTNDFSIWISDSLGEKELADRIAGIDPYVYTLENLRNRIIEQVDTFVK